MRVLQCSKRSVILMAAACVALSACGGDSGPEAPFNPTGTSEDLQAVNNAFATPAFASFSTFSVHFDAALGTAPLISGSAEAFNFRRATKSGEIRAAAVRNARRVAALVDRADGSFSASSAAIPAEVAGKTFEYNGTDYVLTDRIGAPANAVRFIIYAVNPITWEPALPLAEVGYVQLQDLSGSTTQAARVLVVSNNLAYMDYTVSASATAAGGRITVAGYVTDGQTRANVSLLSAVNEAAGLTLQYSMDVPQRDVSIDLSMNTSGLDPETSTVSMDLAMSGPNGTVSMSGDFSGTGGTITVRVNGDLFANVVAGAGEPIITGADGQPLAPEDEAAFQNLLALTGDAFITFEVLFLPIGFVLAPTA